MHLDTHGYYTQEHAWESRIACEANAAIIQQQMKAIPIIPRSQWAEAISKNQSIHPRYSVGLMSMPDSEVELSQGSATVFSKPTLLVDEPGSNWNQRHVRELLVPPRYFFQKGRPMENLVENLLELPPPLFISLKSPKGNIIQIDAYKARKVLADSDKQPSEEKKWDKVLDYLAEQLGLDAKERTRLAQNQAMKFNNAVMELVTKANKELAKENFTTASLPEFIQAFQPSI